MGNIEPLLTTVDVQRRFGVSRTVVWQWRKSGQLKAIALPGNKIRFAREEIERFERDNAEVRLSDEGDADGTPLERASA